MTTIYGTIILCACLLIASGVILTLRVKRCAVCQRWSWHRFDGLQQLGTKRLNLYTSRCCGATKSEVAQ